MKMELRRSILTLALQIAADQYEKDAKEGSPVLRKQFEKQAREAKEAMVDIEDASVIYLNDA